MLIVIDAGSPGSPPDGLEQEKKKREKRIMKKVKKRGALVAVFEKFLLICSIRWTLALFQYTALQKSCQFAYRS